MSFKKGLSVFVVALVLFATLLTPIGFIARFATLPDGMGYQGLEGTIWSGTAQVVQADKWQFTRLSWTLNSSRLLLGKLSYDIKFGQARVSEELSGKGRINIGFSTLSISDLTFRAPASDLRSELPIPTSELSGRVILDIKEYTVESSEPPEVSMAMCEVLSGDLLWTKAEVRYGQSIPLGNILARLTCDQGNILASFDGENKLGLIGEARIASPENFSFEGFVKPDADLPRDVHNGVRMFSQLDSQGRYPIKL